MFLIQLFSAQDILLRKSWLVALIVRILEAILRFTKKQTSEDVGPEIVVVNSSFVELA